MSRSFLRRTKGTLFWLAPVSIMSCVHQPAGTVGTGCNCESKKPRVGRTDGSLTGFDKRDFPGGANMKIWMDQSPYEWTGYYLPSPCFAGTPWAGHRAQLDGQGWGFALVYVGQQAPGASMLAGEPNIPQTDVRSRMCGQNTLTAAQGAADGADAVTKAIAEGFPAGAAIYLDVEKAVPFPAELNVYVKAWLEKVLSLGYVAGLYGHKANADALHLAQAQVFSAAGNTQTPPFWVVNSVGFALGKVPTQSGFAFATVWQNPTDANETYGGVTFRIDQDIASTHSPSFR